MVIYQFELNAKSWEFGSFHYSKLNVHEIICSKGTTNTDQIWYIEAVERWAKLVHKQNGSKTVKKIMPKPLKNETLNKKG